MFETVRIADRIQNTADTISRLSLRKSEKETAQDSVFAYPRKKRQRSDGRNRHQEARDRLIP